MTAPESQHTENPEELVSRITAYQRQFYAYIYSLVHHAEDANDILQETNLELCRKAQG